MVVALGGKLAWVLLLFVPVVLASARRIGRTVRQTTRRDKTSWRRYRTSCTDHYRESHCQSLQHGALGDDAVPQAARRLFHANLRSVRAQAISSPLMDSIGAVAIALLLLVGRNGIRAHTLTAGTFLAFIIAVFKLYDPVRKFALFYNSFQQALGASSEIFRFMDTQDEVRRPAPTYSRSSGRRSGSKRLLRLSQ